MSCKCRDGEEGSDVHVLKGCCLSAVRCCVDGREENKKTITLGIYIDSLSCGVTWTMEARRVYSPRALTVKSADFELVTVCGFDSLLQLLSYLD